MDDNLFGTACLCVAGYLMRQALGYMKHSSIRDRLRSLPEWQQSILFGLGLGLILRAFQLTSPEFLIRISGK